MQIACVKCPISSKELIFVTAVCENIALKMLALLHHIFLGRSITWVDDVSHVLGDCAATSRFPTKKLAIEG